jgi:hypothetical protein
MPCIRNIAALGRLKVFRRPYAGNPDQGWLIAWFAIPARVPLLVWLVAPLDCHLARRPDRAARMQQVAACA